jgi:hypothetical protein
LPFKISNQVILHFRGRFGDGEILSLGEGKGFPREQHAEMRAACISFRMVHPWDNAILSPAAVAETCHYDDFPLS